MKINNGVFGPLLVWLLFSALFAGALDSHAASGSSKQTVSVLYAGPLATVMEYGVGPAFTQATGIAYQGEAQGSVACAQLIRGHLRTPDVFISADALVNNTYLMGPANGDLVKWYMLIASSQIVLAYNPDSPHAKEFEEVAAGKMPWYKLIEKPGVRFGRGDPTIDPKGYRTLFVFPLAANYYHRPELNTILGEPQNPAQVFPEIVLMARVEAGQFDASFFYRHEAAARNLPYITLPAEINLGDPNFAAEYARQSYTNAQGVTVHGAPILFTVTIPGDAQHPETAVAFAKFLLTSKDLLHQYGFGDVPHQLGGDSSQVPPQRRSLVDGAFKP
jgi:molybdate/tungstate transport system substrate-binding protein